MSEGAVRGAVAENVVKIGYVKERILCKVCGNDEMRRVLRHGFFQQNIYSLFGYFPWRCLKCGTRVMLRMRHRRKIPVHAE